MIKSINIYQLHSGNLEGQVSICISDNGIDTLTVKLPSKITESISNITNDYLNIKRLSLADEFNNNEKGEENERRCL
jgi:hypothetical protein